MAVKHNPTGEVHSGTKGGTTGRGVNTKEHPTYRVDSHEK